MAKLFSDGDFADSAPAAVLSESDFADSGEPGQVLSESDFADSPGQDKGSDLRKRLKQKDSLLNKIGYVKNRTKEDKPDAEGLTLDDYRNFVTSSDFNTLDEERLNLVAQAVDAKHADVSKKRGIFKIAADSVARGIPKAIYRTAEGRMAAQADSQENRDMIQAHIETEQEADIAHPRAVDGVKSIRGIGDAVKLAVEVAGENVGNAVAPMAAGIAGAKAGALAGPAGSVVGGMVGAGVGSLSGNLGEAVRDHYNDTGKAGTSVGVIAQGLGYSAIDAALGGEATAVKHLFKGVAGETLKQAKKNFVGSIGKAVIEVAKGGAKGGLGEALQSQVVGRSRRLAETGSALEKDESGTDALWAAADEFYGGFFGDAASSSIGVGAEYSRNKTMLKRADVVISKLSADKDVDSIKGFDKKLVSDYMLGMAAMPEVDAGKQDIIRAKQAEIMDAADGQTKAVLNAYQSMFTDASFDNIPDTVKPTFNAKKAYESKIDEQDGSETYFDADSGIMIQGREGSWSVFNRNGMKMPLTEENNVKTIKDAIGFAQNLTRLNQWRVENNQAKSEFIQKLAEKNHPGANVVMVDSPLQIKDEGIRSRFIGNEQGFYNPGDNTVYMMLDAVQNPAQAAIILAHEDTHRGLMDVLKKGGLIEDGETVNEAKQRLFGADNSSDAEKSEEQIARTGEQWQGNRGKLAKMRDTMQAWLYQKTGTRTVIGNADVRIWLDTIEQASKASEGGKVEYQPEVQSDANKIRYEDAKNGMLTLEEEAQRQNDAAPDEKVSQERVINRDTRRAGLVAGMNQDTPAPSVIENPSGVPSVQTDTDTSEVARPASPVKDFVKTELRTDRIKEKHADLFNQAMDVTDGDEQAATGLVSEWLAGQNIADKSIPDSVRVASKLEQKADLTAKDADTLEQNAVFGKDLFLFGYRKDKQTGSWKYEAPVQPEKPVEKVKANSRYWRESLVEGMNQRSIPDEIITPIEKEPARAPFVDNKEEFSKPKQSGDGEAVVRGIAREDRLQRRMDALSEQTKNLPKWTPINKTPPTDGGLSTRLVTRRQVSERISGLIKNRWNDMSVDERRTMVELKSNRPQGVASVDLMDMLDLFEMDLDTRPSQGSQQPAQEAPQSTPTDPVTSEPDIGTLQWYESELVSQRTRLRVKQRDWSKANKLSKEPKPETDNPFTSELYDVEKTLRQTRQSIYKADQSLKPVFGEKTEKESFKAFFEAMNQTGEFDLLQHWHEGRGLFSSPKKGSGGEYDAYRSLSKTMRKMIVWKSKQSIDQAAGEIAGLPWGKPEYGDSSVGPEMLVSDWVYQYNAYQQWKAEGSPSRSDIEGKRYEAEHRQEQEDLATYKQKVDNGEVIADGSFIAVRTGADTVRMAGVDPEWPIVRVERSRVVNGILVYDAVSPSGSVFTVNADEIEADLGKETEVDDEAERNSFESSYELSELAARKVREDRERDYERDEREAIEGEPPLRNTGGRQGAVQEDEVGKGKGKVAPRGKNDGSLFDEGDLDFNLDGGTQEDVVRIAAEKKEDEDRQKEAKRKLDAAPVLPGVDPVDNADNSSDGLQYQTIMESYFRGELSEKPEIPKGMNKGRAKNIENTAKWKVRGEFGKTSERPNRKDVRSILERRAWDILDKASIAERNKDGKAFAKANREGSEILNSLDDSDSEEYKRLWAILNYGMNNPVVERKAQVSKPKKFTSVYNGKEVESDSFQQAAQRVSDNLTGNDHGYVRSPNGQLHEVSRDKKTAVLVKEMRSKEQREIAQLEERIARSKYQNEKAALQKRIEELKKPVVATVLSKKGDKVSTSPERVQETPKTEQLRKTEQFKRGTKIATTRNADGVSYFGEVLQSNPDGTVKIRAFKEKTKGTIGAKGYGVDKAGNRVTKDVDVPAESVKAVDASADPSKLTDEERRKLKIAERIDAANADNELRKGSVEAPKDLVDSFNSAKERKEQRKTDNGDVMFRRSSVTPEQDAEYLDSVEAGDMETAQRMVEDAAKQAGYTIEAWHATDAYFTVFDRSRLGQTTLKNSPPENALRLARLGFWFHEKPLSKQTLNKRDMRVFLQLENADRKSFDELWDNPAFDGDSVVVNDTEFNGTSYVVRHPSQIKSADAVTRDDQGNVIPLSQRFNDETPDIRFRRSMSGIPSGADILDTETGLQAARRIVQDYMQPWERKQESLQKTLKRKLSDDVDVYRAEDRSYGLIRNGVHQFEKNFIDKAEKVLNENGLTVDEFDQFLMAKAGPDRNKMIADRTDGKNLTGSGQSDLYWNNILAAYRKQGKYDKLNEAAEHVWALNRAVLDMKVEAGLMSKVQADVWKTKSPFYVPLRSDDAEADYKELGKRASFSLKRKESKSATGRAEGHEADTPFAFSVLQALEAVGRANKNKVYETAAKLIEQNPSDLWHIEKRIPTKHAYDAESGKVISVPDAQFEDAPNVVIVKRDGKKQYLVFEGADGLKLARSLKKDSLQKAPAMVSALTRTYAMMRTAMVPTFILRNLRADFLQLTINMTAENKFKMVPEVFKSMKDSWQAVWSYERDGKAKGALAGYANEFFSNGGQIAGVGVQTVDKINQTLNKHVKKHGAMMQKVMKAEHFYEYIERGNATIETGTRLALYATLRKQGYSISDSIDAGKNITVNFNRKGELGPLVNSLYMFSNVAVQDAARSVKALSGKNGKAVVLGLFGAGFLAAMLNNGDDDEEDKTGAGNYKNIPESDKQRNIIIKVGGKYIKQPIRGIWAWVYYAGTKAGDVAFGKYDSAKAAKNVAGAAFDTINFLGTSGSVAQFVTPTILDPVVQHLENKDWKGAPMRQRKFTDAQPDSATGMKRTPEWIKATAKGLNRLTGGDDATKGLIDVAPETIKHVIDTMTGGLGTDASYAVGAVSDAAKGNFDVDKTPFVRDVVRDLPDSTREYYVAKDRFDAGVYAVNHYKTAKERSAYYRENPFMKPSLADRIKNLNKTIKEIRESESKTDNADRKKILEARRLRLQSTMLRLMDTGKQK